jgi:sorting nexin-1/2
MHNNNPGVVVPPPPEKQAVGRFDTEFVESRRQALERMLNKIAAHPILHHDADLKIFLESEAFTLDVKNREAREPDLGQSSKGMLSSIGINVGSSSGKFVEHDDWFHDRKIYLDALENQLKGLMKALDTVVLQRKGLADSAGEFAVSLGSLAQVELSPDFSGPLQGLSDVQLRIQQLYQRQAQQDVLTLGITIDEYIRLVGSVKTAFAQRQKAFHSWHAAESELQKRRNAHEKLLRQGKSQQDKLNEVGAGVAEAEKKAHQARLLFEDMGRLMRGELERFEREKVEDFKSGVETFLEGAVEAQKEVCIPFSDSPASFPFSPSRTSQIHFYSHVWINSSSNSGKHSSTCSTTTSRTPMPPPPSSRLPPSQLRLLPRMAIPSTTTTMSLGRLLVLVQRLPMATGVQLQAENQASRRRRRMWR